METEVKFRDLPKEDRKMLLDYLENKNKELRKNLGLREPQRP